MLMLYGLQYPNMCEVIILCHLFQCKRKPDRCFYSLNKALPSPNLCNLIAWLIRVQVT